MHDIIKYSGGSTLPSDVQNPGVLIGGTSPIGGYGTPGYAPTGSTDINSNIALAMQGLGSSLGGLIGNQGGNAMGAILGNLGSNILSAGDLSKGLSNFAGISSFSKENLSNFGKLKFEGFGNGVNLLALVGSSLLDSSTSHLRLSGKYGSFAGGVDLVGNTLGQFGKFGGYSALGLLGMSAVNKITGGTDGMTLADAALGSSSLAGGLTAINPILGAAYVGISGINSATGKTTRDNANNDYFSKENLASMWGSYGKSYKDHLDALQYGGKKYGGISRLTGSFGRADRRVRDDNERTNTLMNIYDRAELGKIRGEQMADINSLDYRLNTFGGYNLYGTRIGRKGMKIPTKLDINKVREIIESYKTGGQMNVIPEGALHARKNHMEGAGKDYTHKGIPVMDKDGEQQAEIERNEIIFSLRVTQQLERLRNDGSDEAAIKAGKLLTKEIFYNTDDRTGLIQEVIGEDKTVAFKQGGSILVELPSDEEESFIDVEEPIGIEEVEYYQDGGNIVDKLDEVRDLHKIVPGRVPIFVLDTEARTDPENGIIYYTDDESKAHEYYGHFQPDLKLLVELAPYWLDLNDEKLQQFGTDLEFVKRLDGDPNVFLSPEEILGRLQAARYMLRRNGIYKVNPQFLINLKANDELKYGNNLRDLLYMYSPEVLSEIFRIANKYPLQKFKEGGTITAEKPSIEIEEFKKGGKKKKTPKEVWKILNSDDNFDDTFIDEPEYNDDLTYQALPKSILRKITEEEWEDFLDDLFSMKYLVSDAKKQNPRFILRLLEEPKGIEFIDEQGNKVRGSHYLSSGEDDNGNGIVYPQIQEQPDGSLKFFNKDLAFNEAVKNKNILIFDSPMDAFRFTTRYKRFFPEYMDNWYKKFGE